MPDSNAVDQAIANPNVPNGMANLGNLLQMAQGIQNYQTGQIQQQRVSYQQQSEQQANQERQSVIDAINSKDPALMPDPNTGLINQKAATTRLMQLAPQTWSDYNEKVNKSNNDATVVNKALLGLDKDQRDALAGIAGAGVGQPVSDTLKSLSEWKQKNANIPGVGDITDHLITQLESTGGDQKRVDSILSTAGLRTKTVPEIMGARNPGVAFVNAGSEVRPTVSTANWSSAPVGSLAGQPISLGVSPGEQETVQTDNAGNPYAVVKDPKTNRITGYRPLQPVGGGAPGSAPPAWNPKPNVTPGGQAGAYPPVKESTGFANKARADLDSNASISVQNAIANGQTIGTALSTIAHARNAIENSPSFAFGPNKTIPNNFVGFFGGYSNPQEASAYLDRLAVDSMAQSGAPHTNAGLSAAQHLSGDPNKMGSEALLEKTRNTEATMRMAQDYSTAVANRYAGHNNYGADKAQFDSAWAGAANPDVWRFEQAIKNNDKEDLDRLIGPTGVYRTKEQIADLQAKRKKIQSMIPGF